MPFRQQIVLRTVGALVLQVAAVAFARQTVANAQTPGGGGAIASTGEAAARPAGAGCPGEPAFGGERHPLYRLTKSDTVDVNFTYSPDFNQSLTVQPDGFVALKGAGNVLVEGLTVPETRTTITAAYRSFMRQPEVTVTLKDFDKPFFLASGEVTRPGKYDLRGDLTVNEAIAIAGGFTPQAHRSQVVVFRRISAYVAESHVVDLKKMLDARDIHEDLHLQPGDFIYVPPSRIAKIRRYVPTNSMNWYMNPSQY